MVAAGKWKRPACVQTGAALAYAIVDIVLIYSIMTMSDAAAGITSFVGIVILGIMKAFSLIATIPPAGKVRQSTVALYIIVTIYGWVAVIIFSMGRFTV